MFRFFIFITLIYLLYKVIKTVGELKQAKNENYQFKEIGRASCRERV
jgi:hypothetical protein